MEDLGVDANMTQHDAAMSRLGQWWLRSVRSGTGLRKFRAFIGGHHTVLGTDRRLALFFGAVFCSFMVNSINLRSRCDKCPQHLEFDLNFSPLDYPFCI
jgi:hypothetical protein